MQVVGVVLIALGIAVLYWTYRGQSKVAPGATQSPTQ